MYRMMMMMIKMVVMMKMVVMIKMGDTDDAADDDVRWYDERR